jgi:hypothetical protein
MGKTIVFACLGKAGSAAVLVSQMMALAISSPRLIQNLFRRGGRVGVDANMIVGSKKSGFRYCR